MQVEAKARSIWSVIFASSAGTMIEWYDFYIFGSLATIISKQFFPPGNDGAALLSTLATFAIGFVVRPFGAIVFGRMGDIVGRKHTFLLTLMMMGLSTVLIGVIPGYAVIGALAPALLILLRLVQGLALGGEYGGAATYVAEHAPEGQRGFYTSFIQTTATLGLFVSLLVILFVRGSVGEADFSDWGWRIPFLFSAVLVVFSYVIRRKMNESPLFAQIKAEGTISTNPLRESFVQPENRRLVLIALFGATAGQGVVWYTGQFYALYFLQTVMNVQGGSANKIIAWALVFGVPFFIFFGWLSDKVGRKKLMLTGCLLAALLWIPIYSSMQGTVPGVDTMGAPTRHVDAPKPGSKDFTLVETWDTATRKTVVLDAEGKVPKAGEKPKTEIIPSESMFWKLVGLVFLQVLFVTMAYGPIAAFLVELFPTRIRYTSMSLPYHIGNGVFGGLVPFIGTAMVGITGNSLSGLWYPMVVALLTVLIGSVLIRETKGKVEAVG